MAVNAAELVTSPSFNPRFYGEPVRTCTRNYDRRILSFVSIPDFMGNRSEPAKLVWAILKRGMVSIPDFMGNRSEPAMAEKMFNWYTQFQSPILWGTGQNAAAENKLSELLIVSIPDFMGNRSEQSNLVSILETVTEVSIPDFMGNRSELPPEPTLEQS